MCIDHPLRGGVAPLRGKIDGTPIPGSPFANELSVAGRIESLSTARSIAAMLFESGGEHMMAFVSTITAPALPIACWTCIRSMLEPCARAAWMLDSGIDCETRIKRTFAIRFDGMQQDLKFAQAMKLSPDLKRGQDQIVKVEQDAVALGYTKLRDRRNRRIGIGMKMPLATEIVREVLDEEGAYRIFSAVSHGQTGTIRQLSYTAVPTTGARRQLGGTPTTPFQKTVDPDHMAWLGVIAAKAFAKAAWNEFTYAGWDREPLRKLFEKTFNLLEASESVRFWR